MPLHALPGSERQLPLGARIAGEADPAASLNVTLMLRRVAPQPAAAPKPLTREDFARRYAVPPAHFAAAHAFAMQHGLTVTETDPARAIVRLSGSVGAFNAAFGVTLQTIEHAGKTWHGHRGSILLPDEIKDAVVSVLGLDSRPIARSCLHHRSAATTAPVPGYDPRTIATLYGFPPGNGSGTCIALIELAGGYRIADLQTYFARLGITPMPAVVPVSVDGATNQPTGDPSGPDAEVALDIEVAGAIAPGARIVVYFAPNTDAGFLDAVAAAVHDQVNKPSVISISWGGPESSWTPQTIAAFDSVLLAAAALGITVCAASGDNGSSDGAGDGKDHVDFPAASPHALACGGTCLQTRSGSISQETVWNDGSAGGAGGGGASSYFGVPPWQAGLTITRAGQTTPLIMRGVPDVSGHADPDSGYMLRVDGTDTVVGGTSAVAPLWAGLIARINAARGQPVGFITPLLYRAPGALRDIASGSNGDFAATKGWDACTGLGSPNGAQAAVVLEAAVPPAA